MMFVLPLDKEYDHLVWVLIVFAVLFSFSMGWAAADYHFNSRR